MKFLIDKNRVVEVEKVTTSIEEKSIVYSWYNKDWEEVEIFDLENWKLAPIVRYLIEWGDEKRSKLLIWLIIWWLIALLWILIFAFSWDEEINTNTNTNINNSQIIPTGDPVKKTETKTEIETEINIESELRNEVEMMTGLKNEAEIETLRNVYELEKKEIEIQKLETKINELTENNNSLEEKLKNQTTRLIESPKDAFIYYLGDNVYEKCENALEPKILNNCKDLYYKYTRYVKD